MERRSFNSRRWRLGLHVCTLLVALVGVVCLTSTRRTLSATFDEGNHLATGLEWWQFGTYTMWTENPPLARVAIAALPYWHGMRLPPRAEWDPRTHHWDRAWQLGTDLLYGGDGFEQNLRRARQGILPFFLIALLAVWALAGGSRSPLAGFLAVALTGTLPALYAHGALATTDVAFAGMFLLATLALCRWFQEATTARGLALGGALGLVLLTKFSALVFFPLVVISVVVARRLGGKSGRPGMAVPAGGGGCGPIGWRALGKQAALAGAALFLVTWAGYLFSIGSIDELPAEAKGWLSILPAAASPGAGGEGEGVVSRVVGVPIPMPEFFHGLLFLAAHDAGGHNAYLLGSVSQHGFAGFYPVALLVKTPLPFLALLILAVPLIWNRRAGTGWWRGRAMALAALAILLISVRGHVNLGIRHVFVLLPLLAVAVALSVSRTLETWQGRRRWLGAMVAGALVTVQVAIAIRTGSAGLGYFNVLAGAEPAAVLLDSDLDWGQDLFNLRCEARARGIDQLALAYFGTLRQCRHDLPPLRGLVPGRPTTGWVAISENYYRHRSTFMLLKDPCVPGSTYDDAEVPPRPFEWLRPHTPVAIVGSSIRLYHIPSR